MHILNRRSFCTMRRALLSMTAMLCFMAMLAPAVAQQDLRYYELDVPYVPTPPEVVSAMLEMAQAGPEDFVIDLGSGDGRIAIAAVRERNARGAFGVDIDRERVDEANENARQAGVTDRVTFKVQDLFKTDLSPASVITMYLLPNVNMSLRPKLLEMPAGTRIVSHAFSMGDWRADAFQSLGRRDVYLWIVPAKVQGEWRIQGPEGPMTLQLEQTFQTFTGTARHADHVYAVRDGMLKGKEIRFSIDKDGVVQSWVGLVEGGSMVSIDSPGTVIGWSGGRQ